WKTKSARLASSSSVLIIWAYLIINVVITLVFLAEHLFISKRYIMALILVLMLWIPFALNDLINKWPSLKHRVFLSITALVVCISSLSGIIDFGHSKFYIRSAGNWIAEHVPKNATLYANDLQLMYYTQHFGTRIFKTLPDYLNLQTISNG